jgi:putative phosphoesterase
MSRTSNPEKRKPSRLEKPRQSDELLVGVVSDTHGLLRPEVLDALAGCDHILHAGDVGDAEILRQLKNLAPVFAVRGNTDRRGPTSELPLTQVIELGGLHLYMLHEINKLDLKPAAAGFAAVIYGHSHSPAAETRGKVLYFNPGSCGPRRFSLPVSLGLLRIRAGKLEAELVTLNS